MKSYIYAALIFSFLLAAIPTAPIIMGKVSTAQAKESLSSSQAQTEDAGETEIRESKTSKKYQTLKVLDITTGQVEEISAYDYVVGAVCAEMPATFEPEALKAQAVAAYTYAVRQAKKAEIAPDSELGGAYFSNDSSKYQAYFTENQAEQYYGKNFEKYYKKIQSAVSEVEGEYMVYEDEPIIAAFHSVSPGKTESAENVWGNNIPYLTAVESEYDTKSPNFYETSEFTEQKMKELLETAFKDIKLPDKPAEWFKNEKVSDSGTVISIKAGDKKLSGQEIRSALSLRSAAFEIEFDDSFKITVKGCGHGVGMSQYGANEMAKTGDNYKEILTHYYKGIEITK